MFRVLQLVAIPERRFLPGVTFEFPSYFMSCDKLAAVENLSLQPGRPILGSCASASRLACGAGCRVYA